MTSDCLAGARENLRKLTPAQLAGLEVLREDVLMSWIGKSMRDVKTGESRLLFAVTSLPAKAWMKSVSLQLFTGGRLSKMFSKHVFRVPQAVGLNCSCHAVQENMPLATSSDRPL